MFFQPLINLPRLRQSGRITPVTCKHLKDLYGICQAHQLMADKPFFRVGFGPRGGIFSSTP